MFKKEILHGNILLKDAENSEDSHSSKLITYNVDFSPEKDSSVCDTLMMNFKKLHLSKQEKMNLTSHIRENIILFQHIDLDNLETIASKLSEKVDTLNISHPVIESDGLGSFICLRSMFMGRMASLKKLTFHFKSTPLALFPKVWAPKKSTHLPPHTVFIHLDQQCWFNQIDSLSLCPTFLKLNFKIVKA